MNERLNILTCVRLQHYTCEQWIAITIYFHFQTDNSPLPRNWNFDNIRNSTIKSQSNEKSWWINHGLKNTSFLEETIRFPGNSLLLGRDLKAKSSFTLKILCLLCYRWNKCIHILFTKVTEKHILEWFKFDFPSLCSSAIPRISMS